VRLGFAVAAHLDPEILVVDEVLAVGDAEFQKKAIGKMQDVSRGEGRTVLFVSHNMAAVKALCSRGILLKNGLIDYTGGIDETISRYLHNNRTNKEGSIIDSIQYESREIRVSDITVNSSSSNIIDIEIPNRTINIQIEGELLNDIPIAIECLLYDSNRVLLAKYAPILFQSSLKQYKAGPFEINETMTLPPEITNGEYGLEIDITYPKVQYMVRFVNGIILKVTGAHAAYGNELRYSDNGFLVLK
jgi:lipopolysaccharide transport system ATP-binding protein